ncbi:globin domain-containing protein [Actinomadura rayongensis]|uniref:nitric oxide dioxygenase n=1 Tax=Actinomadura rayongensis TaxID=1429076 RepID=A0A6I4WE35_9ACTN|nr:globin domain-containing protein [Actinomadura rayongensis]MXQ67110.1 flavohemoprotein [Actinomadura rayongensis]
MSVEPDILKATYLPGDVTEDKAAAYFYGRLFAAEPRLRALFPPAMDVSRDRLFRTLTVVVFRSDEPAELAGLLEPLGRAHRKYGVLPEHYPVFGDALVATLRRFAGAAWSARAEAAWTAAYDRAAALMIAAAEDDAAARPPWWVAEVAEHDRRRADLAVLTLVPDRPYPFEAGQHATVQTSRWPRVWRPYSLAGAPRPDGTLRLHVRSVPGGWVSGALVRETRPGDTLLLGPPAGGLTLDPGSGRDLLLIGGGTGLAPLKALAERAAAREPGRAVRLFAGARSADDLYDLPDLRRLESARPAVRVTAVPQDEFGPLPDALPDLLDAVPDPAGHDVYVAGPPAMVRAALGALDRCGVPADRVRHELAATGETLLPGAAGRPVVHA